MLAKAAQRELDHQIEAMQPDCKMLAAMGFSDAFAAYLASAIKSGAPDLSTMRSHGVDEKTAVSICKSISKRHARYNKYLAAAKPKYHTVVPAERVAPAPAAPEPDSAEQRRLSALSILHDLAEAI